MITALRAGAGRSGWLVALALLALWLAPVPSYSQEVTVNDFVTGRHPRIHFWLKDAPAGIPTVEALKQRAASGDARMRGLCQQIIAQADHDGGVEVQGLAYYLTGDDKYFQAAKRQAFALADDPKEWLDPYHKRLGYQSDLTTGINLHTVGLVYDWFYDRLTPEEREHLRTAIRERGFKLWLQDKGSLTHYTSNWCAVTAGGMGIAALATLEDLPESPELAALAAQHVPRMLGAFGADGGWPEGASYWWGTESLVVYLDALRTATGGKVNYLADPRLRQTCWFPLYFALPPDGMTDFADGDYTWGRDALAPVLSSVAAVTRDTYLQWGYFEAPPDYSVPYQFLFYDPTLQPTPPGAEVPLSKAFRDIGWVAVRNGWGHEDLKPVIAAKAGHNQDGGDQHLDVGNLLVNAFGQRMLVDHGYGNGVPLWTHDQQPGPDGHYRWNDPLYSTPGHNVVVVGGRNQKLDGTGDIATYEADDKLGVVTVLDCTNAYEGVKQATRTLVHLRPDLLVVLDEFDLEKAEPATLRWHVSALPLPAETAPDADISSRLTALREGEFVIPGAKGRTLAFTTSLTEGRTTWSSDAHRRIGLLDLKGRPMPNTIYPYLQVSHEPAARQVFLSAFAFLPSGAPTDVHWRREGAVLRLAAAGREIVVLAQPGASAGGLSGDARLVVADTAAHHAACVGGSQLTAGGRATKYQGAARLLAW